nr:GNAT family N-acetyltransferase [Salibacterium aidingense]
MTAEEKTKQYAFSWNHPRIRRNIQFRPVLEAHDFHILHGWMHQEHVIPFWQLNQSEEAFRQHLKKALADSHQSLYIGCLDGRPMSYWEAYWAADDVIGGFYKARSYDQGIHLLIGPAEDIGKGCARPLVEAMISFQFREEPRTRLIVAEPDIRNDKMIHVFKQCGFEAVKPVDLPDKRGLLMGCRRETWERSVGNEAGRQGV